VILADKDVFVAAIQDEISRTAERRYFRWLHAVLNPLKNSPASTAVFMKTFQGMLNTELGKNLASKSFVGL
jgi:hypothetical protein